MLSIEPAGPGAMAELADDICAADMAEMTAAGLSVQEGLADVECQALRLDGRLVCLFGLTVNVKRDGPDGPGVPWMLCTNAISLVPRRWMALTARAIVSDWQASRAMLINMVHRRNARAVRFIEWLEFEVDRRPAGPDGEFWVFQWRRNV